MTDLLASPWIPTMALMLLAFAARVWCGSWLAPTAFAPAIWSGFIAAALWIAPEYPVSSFSVWLIAALILSVMAGALYGEGKSTHGNPLLRIQSVKQVRLLPFIITFSLLAALGAVYLAIRAFNEHDLPYSIGGFLAIGHYLSVVRYSGEEEPLVYRALITWIYPAAMLGGIDFALASGRRRKLLSLAAFVPALLVGFFQSERAPSLIAFCLWLGIFLAIKAHLTGGTFHLSMRRLVVGSACLVLGFVCFYVFLDAIRSHKKQDDFIVEADWARVRSSFVGSLSVFSQWAHKPDATRLGYGAYTFSGVFNLLGIHAREQGIFEIPVTLPDGAETNIYSAFRGLIQDFSLPGALMVCAFVGVLSGVSYRNSSLGRFEWTPALGAYYAFICFSPIVSLFTYNGPILALTVCTLACRAIGRPAAQSSLKRHPQNASGAMPSVVGA